MPGNGHTKAPPALDLKLRVTTHPRRRPLLPLQRKDAPRFPQGLEILGDPNPEASPKGREAYPQPLPKRRGFFCVVPSDAAPKLFIQPLPEIVFVVPSDAALALPIPPKVQSRPAGHMQA